MPNSIINSDNGVISGQSGLKTSGGDDGVLALQNNGTTNVAVTAAGLVGIGTVAPVQKLHVAGATSTYIRVSSTNTATGAGAVFANNNTTWVLGAGAVGGGTRFEIADQTSGSEVRLGIDSAGVLQFNSGYGSTAAAYGVRAWVNFNGATTIRASGGVSSIANPGLGIYTVNFSITMPDIFYAPVFFSDANSGITISQPTSASTTSVSFTTRNGAGTYFSGTYAGVAIVR
jgi:hypothetical protein